MQGLWLLSWSDGRPMAFLVPAKVKKQKPYWERQSEEEGREGKQFFPPGTMHPKTQPLQSIDFDRSDLIC